MSKKKTVVSFFGLRPPRGGHQILEAGGSSRPPGGVGQNLEAGGSEKEAGGSTPPTPPANRTLHTTVLPATVSSDGGGGGGAGSYLYIS